jgi:hypothetical protein
MAEAFFPAQRIPKRENYTPRPSLPWRRWNYYREALEDSKEVYRVLEFVSSFWWDTFGDRLSAPQCGQETTGFAASCGSSSRISNAVK